jgi:hypothetical protein
LTSITKNIRKKELKMIRCNILREIIALLREAVAPKDKILLTPMVAQNQGKAY